MSVDVQQNNLCMKNTGRQQVWNLTGGLCFYCQRALLPDDIGDWRHPLHMNVDHKIPRRRGGSDLIDNLAPCCRSCNSNKGPKTIDEYRVYLFGLGQINFFFGEPSRTRDWLLLAPFDPREQVAA